MKIIPEDSWTLFSNQLILYGRNLCNAGKPGRGGRFLLYLCEYGRREVRKA